MISKLRNQTLDANSQFRADLGNFKKIVEVAQIPLINGKNESLLLQITFLLEDMLRIKIVEVDHSRYELTEALDGEPETTFINKMVITGDSLTLASSNSNVSVVVKKGPPFEIIFYFAESVQMVLKGDRLSPVYYRGGSIIPRKDRQKLSATEMQDDPYSLYVNLDLDNGAEGRIYVDDYTSFDYSNENLYVYMNMIYISTTRVVRFELIDVNAEGLAPTIQRIIISEPTESGVRKTVHTTTCDGTPLDTIDLVKQTNDSNFNVLHLQL